MNPRINLIISLFAGGLLLSGEPQPTTLPLQEVFPTEGAHEESAAGLTNPISALRFQPRLDLQTRNFVEGQSDIILRGGTFENSGVLLGGSPLMDPQTGHYLAEIPVATDFLGPAEVFTGVDNALRGFNASVGTIAWDWSPIATRGNARLTRGQYRYRSAQFYQGIVLDHGEETQWGMDGALGWSRGDGTRPNGEHRTDRYNIRTQYLTRESQTDLFYGYQSKFFGWPNLYTPFNSNETENLQTHLLTLNYRRFEGILREVSLFYRHNRDQYQFNRFNPTDRFKHETDIGGVTARLGGDEGVWYWESVHGVLSDQIRSNSLGRSGREYFKNAFLVGRRWAEGDTSTSSAQSGGGLIRTEVGATWEATNREGGAIYPLLRLRWNPVGEIGPEGYAEFSGTSQVPGYTALNSAPNAGLFRGNPGLGRERSFNYEIGWKQPTEYGQVHAALFFRQDRDLVDWTFSSGSPNARSASTVDTDTYGIELLWAGQWDRLSWSTGYTYIRKLSDYGDDSVDASFYALNYPRHRFSISTELDLDFDLTLRFDQQYRWQSPNPLRQAGGRSGWYGLASLNWEVYGIDNLFLEVGVDNLWNSKFQEVPQVPFSARRYYVSVSYAW